MRKFYFWLSFFTLNTWASSPGLTLYMVSSPHGVDWTSPQTLMISALKNQLSFKKHFLGHVFVEFKCGQRNVLTSMAPKSYDIFRQLILENRGLGILFHSFPGRLQERNEIENELQEIIKEQRATSVHYRLNQEQCDRITAYYDEYKKEGMDRYYGLANRPLYGEGGGSSAFAASFVEVAGLMDQDLKDAWARKVSVPLAFAGPPVQDQGVNILKVILGAKSWAHNQKESRDLIFWDPDKMHAWVKGKEQVKGEEVIIDASSRPSPQSPIWKQHLDSGIKAN